MKTTTLPPSAALRALYEVPLEGFVPFRAKLARDLRAAGKKDQARAVLALGKPSAAAWSLNQLARQDPEAIRTLLRERQAAERAQTKSDIVGLRATVASYRAGVPHPHTTRSHWPAAH